MRRTPALCALALALVLPVTSAYGRPRLPHGWPRTLQLGLADRPGRAPALRRDSGVAFRYQYLAGGVNTGSGWTTWNPAGSFVTRYVRESIAAGRIPVFTYYQLLQSRPAAGGDEAARDLSNLRNASTMRAYWADLSTFLRRAGAFRRRLIVAHIEPDLWGYLEQAGATGLAASFARRVVALRNRLAPNVALAWHLSVWGTKEDPTYGKPSLRHMDALGAQSARFYRSLRTRFDLVFNDVSDRDAGFYARIEGNPRTAWGAGDFRRHVRYIASFTRRTGAPVVLWQLPLGNATLNDTWQRFRDTRVEWWLGRDSRAHLRAERAAGVVALLFGAGADGCTTERTDGGLFNRLARRYERAPLGL